MRQLVAFVLQALDPVLLMAPITGIVQKFSQESGGADDVGDLLIEELIEFPLARYQFESQ